MPKSLAARVKAVHFAEAFKQRLVMKKYKIFVEADNLLTAIDGKIAKRGFYTTRFVEGNDAKDADHRALLMIREELKSILLNTQSDPPTIVVKENSEIETFGNNAVPGEGFTWFDSE